MENSRIIILNGAVDEKSCSEIILQLLYLNSLDNKKPIYFYIHSNGGEINSGLAVYDTIQYIEAPVYTICVGLAASMGAFLLTCGAKRSALKHATILIHQPRITLKGASSAKQSEIKKIADGLIDSRNTLEEIMAKNIGVSIEQIHKDCENDNWMSAEEALKYGIIQEIVEKI